MTHPRTRSGGGTRKRNERSEPCSTPSSRSESCSQVFCEWECVRLACECAARAGGVVFGEATAPNMRTVNHSSSNLRHVGSQLCRDVRCLHFCNPLCCIRDETQIHLIRVFYMRARKKRTRLDPHHTKLATLTRNRRTPERI